MQVEVQQESAEQVGRRPTPSLKAIMARQDLSYDWNRDKHIRRDEVASDGAVQAEN